MIKLNVSPLPKFHTLIHLHERHLLRPNGRSYCIHKSYQFISTPAKVVNWFLSGSLIDQPTLNKLRELLTNLHCLDCDTACQILNPKYLVHFPNTWYGFKKAVSSPLYPGFACILNAVTTVSMIVLILKKAMATMAEQNHTSQAHTGRASIILYFDS